MLRSTSDGFKQRNLCSRALLKPTGSRSWAVFMIWRPARLASCLKFVPAQTYRGQPIRIKADIIVLNNWCACMKHSGRRHVVAWGEAWQTKAPPPQKKAPALRHLYAQIDSRRVEFGGRARANSGPLEPEPDARWTGRRRRASQKSCRLDRPL
jgi:hypothetical protein